MEKSRELAKELHCCFPYKARGQKAGAPEKRRSINLDKSINSDLLAIVTTRLDFGPTGSSLPDCFHRFRICHD
jgi:hypothetical protein